MRKLTIAYSSHFGDLIDKQFEKKIKSNIGLANTQYTIKRYVNYGELSLTQVYNKALRESDTKYVLLIHNDIQFLSKNWGRELLDKIDDDYGIIGIAGSKRLHPKQEGCWWKDITGSRALSSEMIGKVYHTNENSQIYESRYSNVNGITDAVLIDGLFMFINKDLIKTDFDESYIGYHFYDISFCISNFINNVKIGVLVSDNFAVLHMSQGKTNDKWEKSREQFFTQYPDEYSAIKYEDFTKRKLRVLLGCLNLKGLTGSELLTMELARGLKENNCDVTIVSQLGEDFKREANFFGIKTYDIREPEGFKLGDGKWMIQTQNGKVPSEYGKLYKQYDPNYDIIHTNHTPITNRLLQLYPNNKFVNLVGSEIIDLENPVIDGRIKKYIAIRPSIKDYLIKSFGISEDKIILNYNVINEKYTRPIVVKDQIKKDREKSILFVGTMDYLRKNAIHDLINTHEDTEYEIWLVGYDTDGWAKELSIKYNYVKYFEATPIVEEIVEQCDITAGIFLGRTTIEGYLRNKPAIIYYCDKMGNLTEPKEFHEVPNLVEFDRNYILNKMKTIYIEAYNEPQ